MRASTVIGAVLLVGSIFAAASCGGVKHSAVGRRKRTPANL